MGWSGKTYAALQRLKEAKVGAYCGPLRLLALEVHELLNREGVYTDLVTGQVCPPRTCLSMCVQRTARCVCLAVSHNVSGASLRG